MLRRIYTHRQWHTLIRLVVAMALIGGAAAAGAATIGVFSSNSNSSTSSELPSFSVLNSQVTPLPSGSFTYRLRELGGTLGVDAHAALTTGGAQVFAVETKDKQYLCLVVRLPDDANGGYDTANTCRLRTTVVSDGLVWIIRGNPNGPEDLFGIVPDGVASVTVGSNQAQVVNNAFALSDLPSGALNVALDGPSVHNSVTVGGGFDRSKVTLGP